MPSPTWTDLEARFRALLPAMKWYRIDHQWGSAGVHWYLQGGMKNATTTEFETLCTIAGDLLLTLPRSAVAPDALAEPKAKYRWFLALWHHMTSKTPQHLGFESGKREGTIFSGTIKEPVHLSATLCLQFSTVGMKSSALVRFQESSVGKFLWWFGEEPLGKWFAAALAAGAVALASGSCLVKG